MTTARLSNRLTIEETFALSDQADAHPTLRPLFLSIGKGGSCPDDLLDALERAHRVIASLTDISEDLRGVACLLADLYARRTAKRRGWRSALIRSPSTH